MSIFSLIPSPYRLIAMISLMVAFTGAVYAIAYDKGFKRATTNCEAAKFKAVLKYEVAYKKAVDRGNVLAQQLATREATIVYRTKEVIKNVPKVTSGKPCLNSAAVSMLNYRPGNAAVPEAARKSSPESTADIAATDTDAAYWIADANSQYEIAAARLNALVDYIENGQ